MIVELRRYTLREGRHNELIDLFDREFVETREELGMAVLGQFRDLTSLSSSTTVPSTLSGTARAASGDAVARSAPFASVRPGDTVD